jgi:hypothetical protein
MSNWKYNAQIIAWQWWKVSCNLFILIRNIVSVGCNWVPLYHLKSNNKFLLLLPGEFYPACIFWHASCCTCHAITWLDARHTAVLEHTPAFRIFTRAWHHLREQMPFSDQNNSVLIFYHGKWQWHISKAWHLRVFLRDLIYGLEGSGSVCRPMKNSMLILCITVCTWFCWGQVAGLGSL